MANPNTASLLNQPTPAATRKSVTGFVTKLVGDGATYGFINDEIFFQQTNVVDGPAGVNDRVFADCEYSEHLPIKWNATSIKILTRASSSSASGQLQQTPACNILESDPRRQSRQSMLLNQQQQQQQQQQQPQPTSQPPMQTSQSFITPVQTTVANSYQQHRQQKQQQTMNQNQHEISIQQAVAPQPLQQLPLGMVDHTVTQGPEFFSPFNQPPPMAQHPELQPFPIHDSPMGPPKLEYTSQLGSAFVQNQFIATPMLPQQSPQPMLPQQPQQRPPQQQQQQQGQQQNQMNQRNQNNKGRFNEKNNDRNQTNRSRNRNDKFEQNRSNERENSNSRQSRNSRDRSDGRGDIQNRASNLKRESSNSRQSPQSNTTRSTNNTSSDRSHKSATKRYEPHNIPKSAILHNMNSWNMRSRCSSSIHVPSDLKNVIVNHHLRLDIKNIPKPIKYQIESLELDDKKNNDEDGIKKDSATELEVPLKEAKDQASDSGTSEESPQGQFKKDSEQQNTPPSSKSDMRLNHKYGVKIVLISLPELEAIYKKVFGPDLDSFTSDVKCHPKLDESIELLCNKSLNGGHSLIGGKFDPFLDGFVEGEINEFERHGKQPDLIATCRRIVMEQTGLDLGSCQSWTLVSTFIYNNKTEYFSSKASIEYSFIYMPHIWTIASLNLDESLMEKESLAVNVSIAPQDLDKDDENDLNDPALEAQQRPESAQGIESQETNEAPYTSQQLSELKVADLKAELEKRGVVFKPSSKKADLMSLLQASITSDQTDLSTNEQDQPDKECNTDETKEKVPEDDQREEGEVLTEDNTPDQSEENTTDAMDAQIVNNKGSDEPTGTLKRKAEQDEEDEIQPDIKKIKDEGESPSKKGEKVELIKEPIIVKARKGQQQLCSVSLHDAVQVSRYDQFELSVASHILKEALVQHLSEYIFTTLVEDNRSKSQTSSDPTGSSSSTGTNSQETNNSDTNNNSTSSNRTAKNPQQTSDRELLKECPVDRYITLAFSYFDSTHRGYLHADDLSKLLNNAGITISKRALMSLLGDNDKFNYRTLPDLSPRFPPTYVYKFPEQFNRLPGTASESEAEQQQGSITSTRMIEYQGVKYDVAKLIEQVREAETTRVNMVERFNRAIENFDKQADEIHVLEVSRMSLSKSIKSLNDELSEVRRGRDASEKKLESLKSKLEEMLTEIQRK